MLLALLLATISASRGMLQLTRPCYQPPLYRTSHVINILWNWLREAWQIRDAGDLKWYDVVSFTKDGVYIRNSAHIYSLLSPLEKCILWTFHDEDGVSTSEKAMESILKL